MKASRSQVAIIGGGPAGLFLSLVLSKFGIDNVVLERHSMAYVAARIRAGVLEHGTAELLKEYGLADRMVTDGKPKDGTLIVWQDRPDHFIDVKKWTGKQMWAWGQTYIQEDLHQALSAMGANMVHEARDVALHGVTGQPYVTYTKDGAEHRLDCDFIAGCDGFHGPSRQAIPAEKRRLSLWLDGHHGGTPATQEFRLRLSQRRNGNGGPAQPDAKPLLRAGARLRQARGLVR